MHTQIWRWTKSVCQSRGVEFESWLPRFCQVNGLAWMLGRAGVEWNKTEPWAPIQALPRKEKANNRENRRNVKNHMQRFLTSYYCKLNVPGMSAIPKKALMTATLGTWRSKKKCSAPVPKAAALDSFLQRNRGKILKQTRYLLYHRKYWGGGHDCCMMLWGGTVLIH